jgi:glucose/arabinose dehydrogenase
VVANPSEVRTTAGFVPAAPRGFNVSLFAKDDFKEPRYLALAPNGEVFLADTTLGKIFVLHDPGRGAASDGRTVFAEGLKAPFGIAFHENYVYIGNTNEVVRFRFDPKTSKRLGEREHILDLPNMGMHSTRTVVFSADGKKMYVSIGSDSNVSPNTDSRRAAVLIANPDGSDWSIFASGLRNGVGLAINPDTGQLWVDVNERDMLGDNLPPDYFTSVKPGGFYGWPYSYIGKNLDDRAKPQRPDLVAKAIIPDVLLGPHVAPLESVFYTASQFPAEYRHGAFIAEHGSWNRSILNGYIVAFVPFKNGEPSGPPTPFLTGFAPDPNSRTVEGRPVGVVVTKDGSLLVSDDGARVVWKVSKAE